MTIWINRMLRAVEEREVRLRNSGTDIADDVIAQGAEGINVHWRATLSADDP